MLLLLAPLLAHAGAYGDPAELTVEGRVPEEIGDACAADVSPQGGGQLWSAKGCDSGALTKALGDGTFSMRGPDGVYRLARCEAQTVLCPAPAFDLSTWTAPAKVKVDAPARCSLTVVHAPGRLAIEAFDACPEELRDDLERFFKKNASSSPGSAEVRQQLSLTVLPAGTVDKSAMWVVEGHAPVLIATEEPRYPDTKVDRDLAEVSCTFDLQLGTDGRVRDSVVRPPENELVQPCLTPFEEAGKEALSEWRWVPPVRKTEPKPAAITVEVTFRR